MNQRKLCSQDVLGVPCDSTTMHLCVDGETLDPFGKISDCRIEENDIIDIISDEQEDFYNVEEEQIDEKDDAANKTFINPTQVENTDSNLTIKCEICDFRAMSQSEIKNHKTVTHNWCNICFSSFVSQERLKKHLKNKHKIQ